MMAIHQRAVIHHYDFLAQRRQQSSVASTRFERYRGPEKPIYTHSIQGFEPKEVALKIVLDTDSSAAFVSSFGMQILK